MANTDRIGFHKFKAHTQDGQNYNKRMSARAVRAYKARRKVKPGYPVVEPFKSIEDVRHYLQGDRITCLICGRTFKRLGGHLYTLHCITEDDYRAYYKIPWTYGLLCSESKKNYSKRVKERLADGWIPPMKIGEEQLIIAHSERRKNPHCGEIGIQNLGSNCKRIHKKRHITKRGTEEFRERMRARPQCQPETVSERFTGFWKGKKQSPEHIAKRFANRKRR